MFTLISTDLNAPVNELKQRETGLLTTILALIFVNDGKLTDGWCGVVLICLWTEKLMSYLDQMNFSLSSPSNRRHAELGDFETVSSSLVKQLWVNLLDGVDAADICRSRRAMMGTCGAGVPSPV